MLDQDMESQINGHLLPITQTHVHKIYIYIFIVFQLLQ